MIVVRDVFQLKFGMAKDAIALMKEAKPLFDADMSSPIRVMVDVTGQAYTMVLESSYPSLAEYEKEMSSGMGDPRWQDWYERFKPVCESSFREIWRGVDL